LSFGPKAPASLGIVGHRPSPVKLNVSIVPIKDCYQDRCL
jgi:hypothetical protein